MQVRQRPHIIGVVSYISKYYRSFPREKKESNVHNCKTGRQPMRTHFGGFEYPSALPSARNKLSQMASGESTFG